MADKAAHQLPANGNKRPKMSKASVGLMGQFHAARVLALPTWPCRSPIRDKCNDVEDTTESLPLRSQSLKS
ncbi:hypothetical protein RB213_006547 [Colletotrichum asianum]